VRVFTRDPSSKRAQELAALPGVELFQGESKNEDDLRRAFEV
jgi:hypothetical protein